MANQAYEFPDPESRPVDDVQKLDDGGAAVTVDGADDIEIVDDTPAADRNRKPLPTPPTDPTDEELQSYSANVRERLTKFTKGYHDERRAKEAAVRERDEAARFAQALLDENRKLKGTLDQGQNAYLAQTKKLVENEVAEAKAKLRAAHETFDPEAITEAQFELTQASTKLAQVSSFRPTPVQQQESVVQQRQDAGATPAQPRLDPNVLAWYGRNQWFGKDRELTSFASGVHDRLVAEEGVTPGSDDYFQRLDERLREVFPDKFDGDATNRRAQPERQRFVASPSRSAGAARIVLTASQVRTANRLGVPLKEYAAQVAEMQRKA